MLLGIALPNNWPTSLTSNRHPQVPQPLTTAPHVAMSHCLPAWKFSFLARLPLASPCLRFVLRVVPYLHVPANHRFPHISPAPLSPLIRQVSTDNFDSAMFTTDQATEHRCQGALNGFPRQAWQGLVTILIFLICLVDVDFLFALYLNIDFHLWTNSPLLPPSWSADMSVAGISPQTFNSGHSYEATLFWSLVPLSGLLWYAR
jgi:hypothetical protein